MGGDRITIELVVQPDGGAERELSICFRPEAPVAELADAVRRHLGTPPSPRIYVRRLRRWLDPDEALGDVRLLRGDVIWIGALSARTPPDEEAPEHSGLELVVVGGPAMGTRHALEPARISVGRGRGCDLSLDDPAMSRKHLDITFDGETIRASDAGSTNGTFFEGVPIEPEHTWRVGDVLEAGASLLAISPAKGAASSYDAFNEGHLLFNRPPRVRSAPPATRFVVPRPPTSTERPRLPLIAAGVPLLLALILWQVFPDNPTFLVFLTLSPLMAVVSYLEERRRGARATGRSKREWHAAIADLAAQIASVRSAVGAHVRESAPDAIELGRRASTLDPMLWLRRPDDDDFLSLRFGWGDRDWALDLQEQPGGSQQLDKQTDVALAPLRTLPSVPLTFSLKEAGVVGLAGDAPAVSDALRWWVAQIAVLHSPGDVSIVAVPPEDEAEEWGWLRWLPHASVPSSPEKVLAALADAADEAARSNDDTPRPATVLLLHERSAVPRPVATRILRRARNAGTYVVWSGSQVAGLPGESRVLVEVTSDPPQAVLTHAADGSAHSGTAEGIDPAAARKIALALAPVVDAAAEQAVASLPRSLTLYDALGGFPSAGSISMQWQNHSPGLIATIGRYERGLFTIDLVADGPHALIGGMTGAGKSELLQTVVASLASTYPPTRLNFLMIDYKGGAAFKDCKRLPHTVGLVTDLDAGLARRALVSLEAEVREREAALAEAGARDVAELEQRPDAACPPRLVILIDEFATLVKELPSFIEGVVDIAQRGRSLGLHLVLATQRPAGSINDAIRANTNLRVALRVADEADSRDVVGIDAAAHISRSAPGRAYVRMGHAEVVEVQTARASAPVLADTPVVEVWDLNGDPRDEQPPALASAPSQLRSFVDAVVEAATGLPVQRSPWLPPLPARVNLSDLPGDPDGPAIGLLDEPHLQRQRPYVLDLRRDGGLMVCGTGGSGKTTALMTVAACLATGTSPERLHLYGLDMTSGSLKVVEALPHCGEVVSGDDVEKVRRLIFMLLREIRSRKEKDRAEVGPDIVVLVDGFAAFTSAFERIDLGELVDAVPRVISDGRGVGIYFVLTAERRAAIPGAVAALFTKKLVLRLGDEDDYTSFGLNPRDVKDVPLPPGRGFIDGTLFQAAVVTDEADERAIRSRLEQIGAEAPRGSGRPAPVGGLPLAVGIEHVATPTEPGVAPIGVRETDLAPATIDLRHGHAVIGGPYRSGRSTALGAVAAGIAASTPDADLYLLAPRRTSIAGLALWTEVVRGVEACKVAVDRLRSATTDARPIFVFVDDADEISDGPAGDALESLAKKGRDGVLRVVAAAEVRSLHRVFGGWLSELRKDKLGLLLDPDLEIDGDLLGVRLPRRTATRFPPGRGYLVERGSVELVQVAQPR